MKWIKSKFPGVRYREHPTRKHGILPDKYFTLVYKLDGKTVSEAVGWASEGMTEKKALAILSELKENRRRGEGPRTLREKRSLEETDRKEQERKAKADEKNRVTFKEVFERYLPVAKASRRNAKSWRTDEGHLRLWLAPVIGDKPLPEIAPIHLEKIKANMVKEGKAPRTIQLALAVVRQVFNFARRERIFNGDNPVSQVRIPSVDNRRLRFLSKDEADNLLEKLLMKSQDVHDVALLSLHTGMRAGEIFSLQWQDVDLERGILTLRDTKSGRTRQAFLTSEAKRMIEARPKGEPSAYVFPARGGEKAMKISHTFWRVVEDLKFNEGIEDPRMKVTFHTLRHTYASWMVEGGTDLYKVKELLGHRDFAMTSRYSHLSANALQEAVRSFEKSLEKKVVTLNEEGVQA
jgi:integrase